MALDIPELFPRELAVRFTDTKGYFVSESSVSDVSAYVTDLSLG